MKIFKRFNQVGALSLHVLLPAVLTITAIGGVGAYVINKSKAAGGQAPYTYVVCRGEAPDRVKRGDSFNLKVTCRNTGNVVGYAYPVGKLNNRETGKNYYMSGREISRIPAGDAKSINIEMLTSKADLGVVLPLGDYKVVIENDHNQGVTPNPTSVIVKIHD